MMDALMRISSQPRAATYCSLRTRRNLYSPHVHATENHGVITRGELILTMNGATARVSAGEWYHVPANVEHSAIFEVETDEIEFWFDEST